MKIQYKFATETVTIEVDDRWGELLVDLNRQEYNNDHKETRRHSSMDALAEQGVQFAAEQDALAALFQEPRRNAPRSGQDAEARAAEACAGGLLRRRQREGLRCAGGR